MNDDDLHIRLEIAVETCFGREPAGKLARFAGVDLRVAQYMLKGRTQPHLEMLEALERQATLVIELGALDHLLDVITRLRERDIHPEVISGLLSQAHQEALARRIS